MNDALALEGIFRELCRQGLALSVRDYLDALSALSQGFGGENKGALVRLCQALWARSSDEDRLVRAVIERATLPNDWERPYVDDASKKLLEASRTEDAEPTPAGTSDVAEADPSRVRLQFARQTEAGLRLPRASISQSREDAFVLNERLALNEREMAIAWRRVHRPARHGLATQLDIEATARAQSVSRVIATPVFVPERSNRACVVLLVDVSASMIAWRNYAALLERSLAQSRLGGRRIYYFDNALLELYSTRGLEESCRLSRELRNSEGSALLVFSDAGAARRTRRSDRVRETRAFTRAVAGRWHPIVWLNPLPRDRWRGTTAELIARLPGISCYASDAAEFTRAMDALRGRA